MALLLVAQEVRDGAVKGLAIDHRGGIQDRELEHVSEVVAQRAATVVVDLGVRDGQHVVGAQARERAVDFRRRSSETLELVVRREPSASRGRPPAKGLADEPAGPVPAGPAVIGRAGEEERVLGPGHRDVREPALLGDVAIAVALGRAGQPVGQPEVRQAQAPRQAFLGRDDEIDDPELEALGFVHRQHVHRGLGLLEIGGCRIIPCLAEELQVR